MEYIKKQEKNYSFRSHILYPTQQTPKTVKVKSFYINDDNNNNNNQDRKLKISFKKNSLKNSLNIESSCAYRA